MNNAMLKRLNLSKTIASGKSTVDSAIRIPGYTIDAFRIGDKLIYPLMANGTFNLHISDGENSDSVIYDEPLYLKNLVRPCLPHTIPKRLFHQMVSIL